MKICECGSGHLIWAKGVCRNCYNRKWRKDNPESVRLSDRVRNLRNCFGITPEEYDQMLLEQKGVCAGCGRPPKGKRLAVDHDHVTDEIRGLLCWGCNVALGGVEDSSQTLLQLIQYLARRKS